MQKMKCDCGLLIHPQYCRSVIGEEGEELIKACFNHCLKEDHKDLPSFVNNLCGCAYCSKCIKGLIRDIKKSEESDIASMKCVCKLEYDFSLFEKVESKDNVMPKCCIENCKNKAQLKNYYWCDCFFCLECLRKHLDKDLVDGFKYNKIKCLGCKKKGLSSYCIPFAGRKYFMLTQSEKNKEQYEEWTQKTSEMVKHNQEEGIEEEDY